MHDSLWSKYIGIGGIWLIGTLKPIFLLVLNVYHQYWMPILYHYLVDEITISNINVGGWGTNLHYSGVPWILLWSVEYTHTHKQTNKHKYYSLTLSIVHVLGRLFPYRFEELYVTPYECHKYVQAQQRLCYCKQLMLQIAIVKVQRQPRDNDKP